MQKLNPSRDAQEILASSPTYSLLPSDRDKGHRKLEGIAHKLAETSRGQLASRMLEELTAATSTGSYAKDEMLVSKLDAIVTSTESAVIVRDLAERTLKPDLESALRDYASIKPEERGRVADDALRLLKNPDIRRALSQMNEVANAMVPMGGNPSGRNENQYDDKGNLMAVTLMKGGKPVTFSETDKGQKRVEFERYKQAYDKGQRAAKFVEAMINTADTKFKPELNQLLRQEARKTNGPLQKYLEGARGADKLVVNDPNMPEALAKAMPKLPETGLLTSTGHSGNLPRPIVGKAVMPSLGAGREGV